MNITPQVLGKSSLEARSSRPRTRRAKARPFARATLLVALLGACSREEVGVGWPGASGGAVGVGGAGGAEPSKGGGGAPTHGGGGAGLGGAGGAAGGAGGLPGQEECFPEALAWGDNGKLGVYRDTSRVAACDTFLFERTYSSSVESDLVCEFAVDPALDAGLIQEVDGLLATSSLRSLFESAPATFGRINPHATSFFISFDGDKITLGSACEGVVGCAAPPEPLLALRTLLESVSQEQLEGASCEWASRAESNF